MRRYRKVVLVETGAPSYHVYSFARLPRLGLPILGAILKQRGYEVVEFCEDIQPIDWRELAAADLVGISTIIPTAPKGYRVARFCKERGIPTIIGGPHVTFMPEEALQHADIVVRGEGEETIVELMEALESGELPIGVKGVSYREGEQIIHNPPRPFPPNLDAIPFPDLTIIRGHERITATPIMTSRGCPFDCSFCSVTLMFGRRFRYRSTENIMDELRMRRPQNVFFYDDTFNANPKQMSSLLEAMVMEGITPCWSAQCRADLIVKQKELLPLIKKSGCHTLYLGLESINPQTLKEYNKRQDIEQVVEAIQLLHRYGIRVHGMFVFGADNDDVKTIRDTVRFALRHQIDTVQFLILTPTVGTRDYQRMEAEGRLIPEMKGKWELYDGHHVVYRPTRLSPYQLQMETLKAMRRFYSLWQCLRTMVTPSFCLSVLAIGWHVLMGKWKEACGWMMGTRSTLSFITRAYGWLHLRRWQRANKGFLKWLAVKFRRA